MLEAMAKLRSTMSVCSQAETQALAMGADAVGPEHLLLGLLAADGIAARALRDSGVTAAEVAEEVAPLGNADREALRSLGVDLDALRKRAEETFGAGALDHSRPRRRTGPLRSRLLGKHLPFTEPAKRALEQALREALVLQRQEVSPETILLALLHDDQPAIGQLLRRLDADADLIRSQVQHELGH